MLACRVMCHTHFKKNLTFDRIIQMQLLNACRNVSQKGCAWRGYEQISILTVYVNVPDQHRAAMAE